MRWLLLLIENTNDFHIIFTSYKKPARERNFFFAINTEANTCSEQILLFYLRFQ